MSAEFEDAVKQVRNLTSLTDSEKLAVYGLYKQAVVGDVNIPQPWSIQITERAKHDAWSKNQGMPKEEAEQKYIALAKELVAKYSA